MQHEEDERYIRRLRELRDSHLTTLQGVELQATARLLVAIDALELAVLAISYRKHLERLQWIQEAVDHISLAHSNLSTPPEQT